MIWVISIIIILTYSDKHFSIFIASFENPKVSHTGSSWRVCKWNSHYVSNINKPSNIIVNVLAMPICENSRISGKHNILFLSWMELSFSLFAFDVWTELHPILYPFWFISCPFCVVIIKKCIENLLLIRNLILFLLINWSIMII